MKITLKDIAQDTGLSVSTVSRALAKNGKISTENIRKVYESAHRLNYPINKYTAPIELRDTIYVALVTHFFPGEFYASFFHGFTRAAADTNIQIGLFNISKNNGSGIRFLEGLKRNHFDAAVVFQPELTKAGYIEILNRLGDFPVVSAAPLATPVMDTIVFDNYSGGHLIAKHFHERGYRKIGIIQGPTAEIETHLRKNGLSDYCEHYGLELVWSFRTDYAISSGKIAYDKFKTLGNKPEAIFAGNDSLATGFMHSAIRDGLKFPDDVAIAGYDDTPICEYLNPRLTSIQTPYEVLAENILGMLKDQIENHNGKIRHSGSTKLIPVSLIERESS